MTPSPWASLLVQVAEVTGHSADWIWRRMPLARCYQYQIEWYTKQGMWSVKPELSKGGGIDRVIA